MNHIDLNEFECRICFEEKDDDELISPCRCNGTSKYIHRGCLNRWREFNRGGEPELICMECKEPYIISKKYIDEQENIFRIPYTFSLLCLNYLISALTTIVWTFITLNSNSKEMPLLNMLNNGNPEERMKDCSYSYIKHNITCINSKTIGEYMELPNNLYSYVVFHLYFILSGTMILYTMYYYCKLFKKIHRIKRYLYLNKTTLLFWNIYCFRFYILYYLSSRVLYSPGIFFLIVHINIFSESTCLFFFLKKHEKTIKFMNIYDNDEEILNWHINPTCDLEFTELQINNSQDIQEEYNEINYSSDEN